MKDLLSKACGVVLKDDRGLILLVFVLFTRMSAQLSAYHGVNRVMALLLGVITLAILLRWWVDGERPEGWLRPALWIGVYIAVCVASIGRAAEPERAWEGVEFLCKSALVVLILVVLIQSAASLRRVTWAVILAGIVMGTACMLQSLLGLYENPLGGLGVTRYSHIVGDLHAFRFGGPLDDPNYFAQVMVVVVPLAVERLWSARRALHLALPGWALFVSLNAVVLTYSRAGVLAVFVVVVMLVPVLIRIRPQRMNLIVMGVLLIALVPMLPEGYVNRMTGLDYIQTESTNDVVDSSRTSHIADDHDKQDSQMTLDPGEAEKDLSVKSKTTVQKLLEEPGLRGRISENIVSYQMFRDHPLLGVGVNSYEVNYQRYSQALGLDPRRERRSAHNLYLETLAETGLLGGAVFGAMLCVLAYGARRSRLQLKQSGAVKQAELVSAVTIGAIGFFVAAVFLHATFAYHMWLLIGLGFALPRVAEASR